MSQEMIDITAPEVAEIQIRWDGAVIWVNVDGRCVLRCCRIGKLVVNDDRTKRLSEPDEDAVPDQPEER